MFHENIKINKQIPLTNTVCASRVASMLSNLIKKPRKLTFNTVRYFSFTGNQIYLSAIH